MCGTLILFIAAFCLYQWMPSFRKADLEQYYGVSEGKTALICNTELSSEGALSKDGHYYIPLSVVTEQLNSRFYWDQESGGIRYILPEQVMTVFPGEQGYHLEGDWKEMDEIPLIQEEGVYYLELEFIQDYTALEYTFFSEPDRLWLWTDYEKPISYGLSRKNVTIRTRPEIKAPIVAREKYARTEKCAYVIVDETGNWYQVVSEGGQIGYIPKSCLGEPAETVLSSGSFHLPEYRSKSLGMPVVLGWNYIDQVEHGLDSLEYQLSRVQSMNVVSPTWFTLSDNEGGFVSRADADYVIRAHESGLQVWGLVENINMAVDSLEIFSSLEARTRLINGLMEQVRIADLDGINLDMESLNEEIAPHYLQFIRELSMRCREADIYLSVDNYVPMPYNEYYDLEEQGEIVDYVIIMGYDQSWNEPGPNSSLEFVQTAIERTMDLTNPGKVIMAMPFYARCWSQKQDGDWNRKTVSMEECETLLASCENAVWLEEEGCYYGTVMKDDVECQIWFEELTSAERRLALIGQYELGGVAAWQLGLEDPAVWELIQDYIVR